MTETSIVEIVEIVCVTLILLSYLFTHKKEK